MPSWLEVKKKTAAPAKAGESLLEISNVKLRKVMFKTQPLNNQNKVNLSKTERKFNILKITRGDLQSNDKEKWEFYWNLVIKMFICWYHFHLFVTACLRAMRQGNYKLSVGCCFLKKNKGQWQSCVVERSKGKIKDEGNEHKLNVVNHKLNCTHYVCARRVQECLI